VSTVQQCDEHDPKLIPLLSREDVRRYLDAVSTRNAARHADTWRKQKVVRRATLLITLCLSILQYYFLSIGVEIVSLPSLTVFIRSAVLQ
jgi:hypothetical protein